MAGDHYSPPSPLGDSLLGSPLCGDLMEDLCDISQSIGDDALGFDFPEYQSTGSGSNSSVALGEYEGYLHHQLRLVSKNICLRELKSYLTPSVGLWSTLLFWSRFGA